MSKQPNIDQLYADYVAKCKKFKMKPSPKEVIFADMIAKQEQEQHSKIASAYISKKKPAPILSDTAKKAQETLVKPTKKRAVQPKKAKGPTRVLLTREEKLKRSRENSKKNYEENKEKRKEKQRQYYKNNYETISKKQADRYLIESKTKEQTPEEIEAKRLERKAYAKAYYAQNKEMILLKAKSKTNPRPVLSDEEKAAKEAAKKDYAKAYREKNKAKLNAQTQTWRDNQDQEALNKECREYRAKNAEKIRAQDRARKEQRKEFYKNNPEALERRRERERKRYQEQMQDPEQRAKLQEKWRRDHQRKKSIVNS